MCLEEEQQTAVFVHQNRAAVGAVLRLPTQLISRYESDLVGVHRSVYCRHLSTACPAERTDAGKNVSSKGNTLAFDYVELVPYSSPRKRVVLGQIFRNYIG